MKTGKINLSDRYPKSIFNITYACSIKRRHFSETVYVQLQKMKWSDIWWCMRSNVSVKINHYATQLYFQVTKWLITRIKKTQSVLSYFYIKSCGDKKQSMHNHLCIDNRLMHDIINHRRYRVWQIYHFHEKVQMLLKIKRVKERISRLRIEYMKSGVL